LEIDYNKFVECLKIFRRILHESEVVMLMGCDTAITNPDIRIEDKAVLGDPRPVVSREEFGNNPINNDVMIWKNTQEGRDLLDAIIAEAHIWTNHGWLWQNHICERYLHKVLIVQARYMNSTFFPFNRDGDVVTQRKIESSWEPGDWIIHALGFPNPATRAEVIKWALGRVNGTNQPDRVIWSD
jgi:hypothetical protein